MAEYTRPDDQQSGRHHSLAEYRRRRADDGVVENAGRILKALVTLATARQARFEEGAQRVYVSLLKGYDPARITAVCEQLAREPRGEYEPAMPELGEILVRCNAAMRRDREALEASERQRAKLLPGDRPVSSEKIAQLKADVQRYIRERHLLR
jgi:hypothetical protein